MYVGALTQLGPLFIHPLVYYAAPKVWGYFGDVYDPSLVQK